MNKTLLIFLLFSFQIFGQNESEVELKPLKLIDTISEESTIDYLKEISVYEDNNHFIVMDFNHNEGLFFLQKKYDIWKVYELDYEFFLGKKTKIVTVEKMREGFIDIQINRSIIDECVDIYGFMFLLNIELLETIMFSNFYNQVCYDEKSKKKVKVCRAEFEIINGILFIKSEKLPNDGLSCIETGEFMLQGGKYIRIN
ncbi:hypothetical protein [Brumimicrobium mesophilum]|uniref:hypothetical protein n=1 Tax=Brumimicrobium mesophilum TaxID=392717 RepID=UPI000D13EE7E|nr:hypothetical protein [Brumimicrobium mesophilum]